MKRNAKLKYFIFCIGLGYLFFPSGEIYAYSPIRPPIRSVAGSKYGCHCPYDSVILGNGKIYRCGDASLWTKSGDVNCYYLDPSRRILSQPLGSPLNYVDGNSHYRLINNCMLDPNCRVLGWGDH